MKLAIVGVTGLVGSKMLEVLAERNFPVTELIAVASENSKGKSISFKDQEIKICTLEEALERKPDIALFSAGGDVSKEWAEKFAAQHCYVVDNSSAWRMDPDKKLIVPEINADQLKKEDFIIANPNCSTIQLVMVLKPLLDNFGLERVVVSTYQSVTGSGQKGIDQLLNERSGKESEQFYPYQIDLNILPHIDDFCENGYSKEEMKMILESKKILNQDELKVTATTVRVPVIGGHSESVNIELKKPFTIEKVKELLSQTDGLTIQDNLAENIYPMPLFSENKDQVFVGRIRKDLSKENALNCWIVADNLRKGAATNTIQIAEYIAQTFLMTQEK